MAAKERLESRRVGRAIAHRGAPAIVATLLFAAVALTLDDYGLTWDEPYYFLSQEHQRAWFQLLRESPAEALSAEAVARGWRFDPYHNPHPPFYKLAANLTGWLAGDRLHPFEAYRLAPALFFAAAGAALFALVRQMGRSALEAAAAVGLWATVPRVFAHAHFAATETPMTFFAVASAACFWAAREHPRRGVALGLVLGAAFATKFTALLLPVPLALWALLERRRQSLLALLVAGLVALPVAVALTPYWWHDPLAGILEHVRVSTSRAGHTPIGVVYWGRHYDFTAPFTQPLVMLAIATPLSFWVPALGAAAHTLFHRLRDRATALLLFSAAVPVAAVMLPSAPTHDGVRMFVTALPFIAALGARGLWLLGAALARRLRRSGEVLVAALAGVAVLAQGLALAAIHPYELSYYNELVGGLRGAERRGMEVTYWMEALTPEVVADLERLLPVGARLHPVVGDPFYLRTLQAHGRLRADLEIVPGPEARYLLVLSRVSVLGTDTMRELADRPVLYRLEHDGVPLVRLYDLGDGR